MIEIANFLILAILICAVAFLLYDRRRINTSLEEKGREGVVTQAELDSYHHRVVQLYQTQRDWNRGKFEDADHRLRLLERFSKEQATEEVSLSVPDPKPIDLKENPSENLRPEEVPDVDLPLPSPSTLNGPTLEPTTEAACEMESFSTTEEKVLKAWAAGHSIDRIAQELRIGRQEVQLLIQVSRRRPAGPVEA